MKMAAKKSGSIIIMVTVDYFYALLHLFVSGMVFTIDQSHFG